MNMDLDAVVCTYIPCCYIAFGHWPLDGGTTGPFSLSCFLLSACFFSKMHNWVLTHMPTASPVAPTRGKYASWKTAREGEIPLSYSAALYECVIVLLN